MLTIRLQAANKELSDANFELKATNAQLEQAQRDLAAAQVRMIFNGLRFSQRLQLPYNVYNTL
jgi:multidrug resistance efflux pump